MKIYIVPDTSALLKAFKQIIDIVKEQELILIIPKIVIDELDKIKDNEKHEENRNAHKVLGSLRDVKFIGCDEKLVGKNNDDKIIECAKSNQKKMEKHLLFAKIKLLN